MSAKIIAFTAPRRAPTLPKRNRAPTERELADRLEAVCVKLGVNPRRPQPVKRASYVKACSLLHRCARDMGLDITINGPVAGGAA